MSGKIFFFSRQNVTKSGAVNIMLRHDMENL